METSIEPVNLRKAAVINALIWAFVDVVLFLLVYYVKPDLMGSYAWGGIRFLIGLGFAIYFSLDIRKKAGGYWSFKEALSYIFTMFVVSALVVYFFTIIFGKYIEPQYVVTMKEITSNNTAKMLEKVGMGQDQIDKAMADINVKMEEQFNPGVKQIFISLGTMILMYFIGSLIFAAIFKKEPPYIIPVTEE